MNNLNHTLRRYAQRAAVNLATSVLLSVSARGALAQNAATTTSVLRVTSAPGASAQPLPRPFDGISLTDDQKTQLRGLTAETRMARATVLRRQAQRGRLSADDRQELARLADAHNARVFSILTATQREQLTANVRAEQQRLQGQPSAHARVTSPSGAP